MKQYIENKIMEVISEYNSLSTNENTESSAMCDGGRQIREAISDIVEKLLKIYLDGKNIYPQLALEPEYVDKFLEISIKFLPLKEACLCVLSIGELYRISNPEYSFKTILLASRIAESIDENNNIKMLDKFREYNLSEALNVQTKLDKCPVCGNKSESSTPYHCGTSYRMVNFSLPFLPAKLWRKCNQCGNLFSKYFPIDFYSTPTKLEIKEPEPNMISINPSSGSLLEFWCKILEKLEMLRSNITPVENEKIHSILEVGAGRGELTAVALEMGYDITCLEIDEKRAQRIADLLQYPIICYDFLEIDFNRKFDFIIMGDVIEHLLDVEKGIKKAYNLLNDNGVIWISTPNYESSYNKLFNIKTAMWNEPTHVSYFNREGLISLLEKNGFRPVDYMVSRHYNGSMEIIAIKDINLNNR